MARKMTPVRFRETCDSSQCSIEFKIEHQAPTVPDEPGHVHLTIESISEHDDHHAVMGVLHALTRFAVKRLVELGQLEPVLHGAKKAGPEQIAYILRLLDKDQDDTMDARLHVPPRTADDPPIDASAAVNSFLDSLKRSGF